MIDRRLPAALLALTLVLAACTGGSGATPQPTAGPTFPPATDAPPSEEPGASPTEPGAEPTEPGSGPTEPAPAEPILTSAWATATLTDVETGETFRIADLATQGRTVFVEAMAIWCSNCRRQMHEFTAALPQLDPATVDYVVVTTEPAETAQALAEYRRQQGFLGRFAVAGTAVSAALAADFGATILNPPSTPKLVIRSGVPEFTTGHASAAEIIALVGD
jgi:thiol-disulfide isomerase/thioredoxin